jgi:hypothetical protein
VEFYEEQPSISYQDDNVSFENSAKHLNPEKELKDSSFSHDISIKLNESNQSYSSNPCEFIEELLGNKAGIINFNNGKKKEKDQVIQYL